MMKKLVKHHKADKEHILEVDFNVEGSDPEFQKQYKEYLKNNKIQLEEKIRNFYL